MGIKRIVDVTFWNDELVIDLFTPEDKYFMLYLLTNPHTKQLGIYKLNKKQASFETGYSVESISALINRFQDKYNLIKYNQHTQEVAIKNYLKHSIIKGGKPVEDCIKKEAYEVKDKSLFKYIYKSIEDYKQDMSIYQWLKTFLTSLNDNDNDNDNDNEVSYHDTYHDTSNKKKPKNNIDNEIKEKIQEWTNDDELRNTLFNYIQHRKDLKKPVKTLNTLNLIFNQLEKNKNNAIEMLNQSILNGWIGLFDIKNTVKTGTSNNIFDEIAKERGYW